jgi:hypothetical protein
MCEVARVEFIEGAGEFKMGQKTRMENGRWRMDEDHGSR